MGYDNTGNRGRRKQRFAPPFGPRNGRNRMANGTLRCLCRPFHTNARRFQSQLPSIGLTVLKTNLKDTRALKVVYLVTTCFLLISLLGTFYIALSSYSLLLKFTVVTLNGLFSGGALYCLLGKSYKGRSLQPIYEATVFVAILSCISSSLLILTFVIGGEAFLQEVKQFIEGLALMLSEFMRRTFTSGRAECTDSEGSDTDNPSPSSPRPGGAGVSGSTEAASASTSWAPDQTEFLVWTPSMHPKLREKKIERFLEDEYVNTHFTSYVRAMAAIDTKAATVSSLDSETGRKFARERQEAKRQLFASLTAIKHRKVLHENLCLAYEERGQSVQRILSSLNMVAPTKPVLSDDQFFEKYGKTRVNARNEAEFLYWKHIAFSKELKDREGEKFRSSEMYNKSNSLWTAAYVKYYGRLELKRKLLRMQQDERALRDGKRFDPRTLTLEQFVSSRVHSIAGRDISTDLQQQRSNVTETSAETPARQFTESRALGNYPSINLEYVIGDERIYWGYRHALSPWTHMREYDACVLAGLMQSQLEFGEAEANRTAHHCQMLVDRIAAFDSPNDTSFRAVFNKHLSTSLSSRAYLDYHLTQFPTIRLRTSPWNWQYTFKPIGVDTPTGECPVAYPERYHENLQKKFQTRSPEHSPSSTPTGLSNSSEPLQDRFDRELLERYFSDLSPAAPKTLQKKFNVELSGRFPYDPTPYVEERRKPVKRRK